MGGRQTAPGRKDVLGQFGEWLAQRSPDALQIAQQFGLVSPAPGSSPTYLGAANRGQPTTIPNPAPSTAKESANPRAPASPLVAFADRLNRNPVARYAAGALATYQAMPMGVVRGGVHAVQGAYDLLNLASRLSDPNDLLFSPHGESALDQVIGAGTGAIDYTKRAMGDPTIIKRDALDALHQANVDLNPFATPMAATIPEEALRNFKIGMNQGELAFNLGTLAYGAPADGLAALNSIGKVKGVAKYMVHFNPAQAERLAKPYTGIGHHNIQRHAMPATILGSKDLADWFVDSPFNVLKPPGMDTGDFYKRHSELDRFYYGSGFGPKIGGSWSSKRLGVKKFGPLQRIWYAPPDALRQLIAGTGAASAYHDALNEDQSQ